MANNLPFQLAEVKTPGLAPAQLFKPFVGKYILGHALDTSNPPFLHRMDKQLQHLGKCISSLPSWQVDSVLELSEESVASTTTTNGYKS